MKRVLITGGAGFIGSHVTDELLGRGYEVRILDCLDAQVHGEEKARPSYLDPSAELVVGDVRDRDRVRACLEGVDAVIHLAARVGVGQSMYEAASYTSTNGLGTAVLLEELVDSKVEKLVVASSMSVYGEGVYVDADGDIHNGVARTSDQLGRGEWEPRSRSGMPLLPVPTSEAKPPSLASVYALSKFEQERMALILGGAYHIPTVALRLFNAYGPRQALSNPYTGVLAVFACRLLNGKAPLIYEDGLQQRDFVSVYDVALAFRLALESDRAAGEVLNVGSGKAATVREIARALALALRTEIQPEITGRYRAGDIRHCFADNSRAENVLGYRPRVFLEDGLTELAEWLEGRMAVDRIAEASAELASRGLA
jgi:dTDP-L-rhamnose 4-epimerase